MFFDCIHGLVTFVMVKEHCIYLSLYGTDSETSSSGYLRGGAPLNDGNCETNKEWRPSRNPLSTKVQNTTDS